MEPTTKRCSGCGIEKPLTEFYPAKHCKYGRRAVCKSCFMKYPSSQYIPVKNLSAPEFSYRLEKRRIQMQKNKERYHNDSAYREKILAATKQWRKKNPEYVRNYFIKRMTGLDLEVLKKVLHVQNYRCPICHVLINKYRRQWNVDHNPHSGKVRGLICALCNHLLGFAREKTSVLEQMLEYLKDDGRTFAVTIKRVCKS